MYTAGSIQCAASMSVGTITGGYGGLWSRANALGCRSAPGGGAVCSAVPVRIEIFINLTRVFGSSPSLYMPHGVPSEIRALVSAKYAGLEIAKIIRYSKQQLYRHIGDVVPQPAHTSQTGAQSVE
jgi:hypothetical protein